MCERDDGAEERAKCHLSALKGTPQVTVDAD